jgi:hypothetical protein
MLTLCRAALVALLLAACGPLNDATDSADTVDRAVDLLQAIDDNNAWDAIVDGLEELDLQDESYVAVLRAQGGAIGDAGALDTDLTITLQVDAPRRAAIQVQAGDQVRQYYADGFQIAAEIPRLYRVEAERYRCAADDELARGLLTSAFGPYAADATGPRTLAVTEETEDTEALGRDATEYKVTSQLPAALDILAEFDNADLRQAVDAAGQFALTGTLALDTETQALLRVEIVYDDLATQRRIEFSFALTQWGDAPPIPEPDPAQIESACE